MYDLFGEVLRNKGLIGNALFVYVTEVEGNIARVAREIFFILSTASRNHPEMEEHHLLWMF